MYHHENNAEMVENCCEFFARQQQQQQQQMQQPNNDIKYEKEEQKVAGNDEDARVFEFELCTKENCEYLSKSQMPGNVMMMAAAAAAEEAQQQKNLLNNEKMPGGSSGGNNNGGGGNQKNINLKHNKFKKTKKAKKGGKTKENREPQENILMWNKIDLNHLMKKENCNINSVNLKPHSSSSSSSSVNNGGGVGGVGNHRRNLKRHQKACDKLFTLSHRQQQSLNVTSLILATSSNSTQARIRNDGGIYFSNPDLSSIPPDLRSLNFINNSNNITSNNNNNNNSCQFINNDLRSNNNNNNNNGSVSSNQPHVHSRSRFDSRFNHSATNYLLESINSNNIDNSNNESFDELMQQQDLRRRLRYINLHGIIRRAQRRARKYLNSLTFASRK
jgi:hypothetical protein